jgi:hypothetical protein
VVLIEDEQKAGRNLREKKRIVVLVLLGKSDAIGFGEFLDSQGLSAGEIFDDIVGASKESVLIVLCHGGDVLHKSRSSSAVFHSLAELWNGERLVDKGSA